MPTCSVVIPTYNNERVIGEGVRTLCGQQLPPDWNLEIIIADDDSTDGTVRVIRQTADKSPGQVQVLPGTHQGAAAARNRAISAATGSIVVLVGGDFILQPGALVAHIAFHERHVGEQDAALGYIQWDPTLRPTPLMEWMNHGGPQNSYDDLLDKKYVDPTKYFYGSNISLKRTFLQREPFAIVFSGYGWEDLELGRRLQTHGLTLHLEWAARGLHRHIYTIQDLARRQVRAGQSLHTYQALYPTKELLPITRARQTIKHAAGYYSGMVWLLTWYVGWRREVSFPRIYTFLANFYMWRGILLQRRAG